LPGLNLPSGIRRAVAAALGGATGAVPVETTIAVFVSVAIFFKVIVVAVITIKSPFWTS